jgi:(4S)-4-hydroxy-5-phosphonooxypentane-2,3-dione isomerase
MLGGAPEEILSGFVVCVEFEIRPELFDTFRPLMVENARASLRDEPGCRQFDVCVPADGAPRILLYEVYDDEAAFEAHLEAAHFKHFTEATRTMIAGRRIVTCHRL